MAELGCESTTLLRPPLRRNEPVSPLCSAAAPFTAEATAPLAAFSRHKHRHLAHHAADQLATRIDLR